MENVECWPTVGGYAYRNGTVTLATVPQKPPNDAHEAEENRNVRDRCRSGRTALLARLAAAVCLVSNCGPAGAAPQHAGLALQPDSEINLSLARAVKAMRAGDHDNALPWLLRVFRTPPPALATTNGVTFIPARKVAADLIRKLPEETLAAHYLRADTSPEIAPTDVETLEAHYNRLLPGIAAMETGLCLAGLHLDQERFVAARRVLLDLLDEYPQEHVSRSELLARLVVACARIGDATQAEWAWSELRKEGDTNRWSFLAAELRPPAPPASIASNAWTMAYGGPRRGAAAALPGHDSGADDGWILLWGLNLGPGMVRDGLGAERRAGLPAKFNVSRSYAAMSMTGRNHRPSDDVIFSGNRAWINGFGECVTVDLDSGRAIQRTVHVTDDPAKDPPGAVDGTWVFGNRLNRAASLIGGRVYCVEDNYRSSFKPGVMTRREWVAGKMEYLPLPCGNALAAYEAGMGRLLWRTGREILTEVPGKTRSGWRVNAIRFAAAPVQCAGLLLVPVEDDSGLDVVGLDPDRGAPVWRTRLSPGFPRAEPRAALANLTVDGAYAYLCNGKGSVSALDGYDGTILWTTLYEPFFPSAVTNPLNYAGTVLWTNLYEPLRASSATIRVGGGVKTETTWAEGLTLVVGETVVALPDDSSEILAFDRRTGARLWRQPKPDGANYVVGRRGARLIVAGGRAVACVDLSDGREQWRTPIEGSTGRGALYGPEVLIPGGRRILRLRIEDGVALEPARAQTMDGLPLGNLYVNGNQLLVVGLERFYALADARPEFARLTESLAQRPTAEAYAERGGRYAGLERYAEAVADLREAWKRQRGSAGEEAARRSLLAALWSAAGQDPGGAESFCVEAREIAGTATERAESTWRRAQCRERVEDTNGALTLYAALVSDPDVLLAPDTDETDWDASAYRLAAQRIMALSVGGDAKGRALLDDAAAQALAGLGQAPACTALVEVATFFPRTRAGRDAAIRAADLAADRGDLGTAEAILQRALALATHSNRVDLAEQLVRLYGRMKWPTGAVRLRDEWPRLSAGMPAPEFLTRAATSAVGVPLPPWRLRWRRSLPGGTGIGLVAGGLFYWNGGEKHTGCLDLASGEPRWQKDCVLFTMPGEAIRDDSQILLVYTGDSGACVDVWSGAIMTNALFRGPGEWLRDRGGHDHNPMTLSRIGMTTVNLPSSYADMVGVDVLAGKVVWRRGDMDTLLDWLMWSIPVSKSAAGTVLSSIHTDETRVAVSLDPWTGAIAARRSFDPGAFGAWTQRMYGRAGSEDPFAMDRGNVVLEDRRLTVKNVRTGAVIWSSAPDIAVVRYSIMSGGMVVAQSDTDELLLLNGSDGRIECRSGEVRFAFDEASFVGNAVVLSRRTADGAGEVIVLDPAAGRSLFHGRLPEHASPLMSLGPTMPDQLLVRMDVAGKQWVQVVNTLGKETNKKWRLPGGRYHPVFADGLIVLLGDDELLAYEHDPE